MKFIQKPTVIYWTIAPMAYIILALLSWNNGYFWDNTQHTSIEAHWYYLSNFQSLFIPKVDPQFGTISTGAPVFLPLLTAFLWKTIAYKVWISHAIALFTAIFLLYNTWKLCKQLFSDKYAQWIAIIILLESSVLTQFTIAGPDFILFTAFVILIRAVIERNEKLILISAPILFLISTRGTFTGGLVFLSHFITLFIFKSTEDKSRNRIIYAYLPAILLTVIYYSSYFYNMGWFFTNSSFSEAHQPPKSIQLVIGNFLDLGLRLLENGRIIFWIITIVIGIKLIKLKAILSEQVTFFIILFALLNLLYIVFAIITNMPFLTRYYMPHILLLTLFSSIYIIKIGSKSQIKWYILIVLFFELTGNFWLYPEKMTKIWDSTLTHLPFYNLRDECYKYIDDNNFNYNDVSAGFCLCDDRMFYELDNKGKIIGRDRNRKYFIYSNVSTIIDEEIDDFKNPNRWKALKKFEKWPVTIVLYQNMNYKAVKTNL